MSSECLILKQPLQPQTASNSLKTASTVYSYRGKKNKKKFRQRKEMEFPSHPLNFHLDGTSCIVKELESNLANIALKELELTLSTKLMDWPRC